MFEYIIYGALIFLMSYMTWEAWRMLKREEEKYRHYDELDETIRGIVDDDPL